MTTQNFFSWIAKFIYSQTWVNVTHRFQALEWRLSVGCMLLSFSTHISFLALTGFGLGWGMETNSSCSEGVDSPILRTVVPGVELQKHTKTEIGLWQGEHSLHTPFQSEVIDMRCCLRLRLSPAFAMRHDISPNCRWLPQVCAKAHFRRQAKHLLLSVLVVCHFSIWYPWYPCRGPKPLSYFIPP